MTDQQAFDELKRFFETRPACAEAADSLRQSVEIGVVINDQIQCAFFKTENQPRFEQRAAKKPDIIFTLNTKAIEKLVADTSDDIGLLGINIVKSYTGGDIKISIKGSTMALLTNGYLGVIKSGGLSFTKFLASHGISGLGKVKEVIQNMRKKS